MSVVPQHISIDSTFGKSYVRAEILKWYFYLVSYPEDSRENKALVRFLRFLLLDSLHTAFISITVYHYLVTNYNNPPSLAIGHWLRWWLTSIIGISVLVHFGFGVGIFIKREFARLSDITVLIAGSLCVLLHGSRTDYKKTNAIINSLIVYAINRCLLTLVVGIVETIMFSIMPKSLWYLAIDFVYGKLYANSLLATLNSRQFFRATNASVINSTHLTDIAFAESTESTASTSQPVQRAIVIDVHVESTQRSNDSHSHLSTRDKVDSYQPIYPSTPDLYKLL
ncbi:hypothetical protein BYT27DRAFT_7198636 [Phlegmacium glaucopus]|nr:hypothetical protein BYT27DRAFT_7198636 [Phlegmacium glaucopus]